MKGKQPILILGLLLVVASCATQWYSTGGDATPLALDDYRVKASLDYLASQDSNRKFATNGKVESVWMRGSDAGFRVSLIVRFNDYPWNATVRFSGDGMPFESSVVLTGGLPVGLRRMGIALVILWFVAGVLGPRVFGRKCPECRGSFWHPVFLDTEETLVYPGGFDDRSDSLPPIKRLDYVCKRCGYRRVTYFTPVTFSPGKVFKIPFFVPRASPKQAEMYQKMFDQWFVENPKRTRFHTQAEWHAFYDELKASEHEERLGLH
jgi:hypothetical protein